MTSFTVTDDFSGTAGNSVDSRPPVVSALGSVWSGAPSPGLVIGSGAFAVTDSYGTGYDLILPTLSDPTTQLGDLDLALHLDVHFALPSTAVYAFIPGFSTTAVDMYGGITAYFDVAGGPFRAAVYIFEYSGVWHAVMPNGLGGTALIATVTTATAFDLELIYTGGTLTFKVNGVTVGTQAGVQPPCMYYGSIFASLFLQANNLTVQNFAMTGTYAPVTPPFWTAFIGSQEVP